MRVFGFVLILVLILMGMANGGKLTNFVDAAPMLLVLGTALGALLIGSGVRSGRVIQAAFSKNPTEDELRTGRRGFRTMIVGALVGGYLSVLAGIVMMLQQMPDMGAIGPGMATVLLGSFWSVLLAYFILRPLQAGIDLQMADSPESESRMDLLPLGTLLLALITIALIAISSHK